MIGLLKGAAFKAQTVQLAYGDVLFAYTDGISEAMTIEDEEWGEDRMLAAVQNRDLPANENAGLRIRSRRPIYKRRSPAR